MFCLLVEGSPEYSDLALQKLVRELAPLLLSQTMSTALEDVQLRLVGMKGRIVVTEPDDNGYRSIKYAPIADD